MLEDDVYCLCSTCHMVFDEHRTWVPYLETAIKGFASVTTSSFGIYMSKKRRLGSTAATIAPNQCMLLVRHRRMFPIPIHVLCTDVATLNTFLFRFLQP
jgi:hypothetical protein